MIARTTKLGQSSLIANAHAKLFVFESWTLGSELEIISNLARIALSIHPDREFDQDKL